MNRVIKFRGKRVDNGEWVYGDLLQLHDRSTCSINPIESNVLFRDRQFVHPESVGQFTGLTDKNGMEIYENDVVFYFLPYIETTFKHIVKYDQKFACFSLYENQFDQIAKGYSWMNITDIKIIGNLHDNPELLP